MEQMIMNVQMQDRAEAGYLLSRKLAAYKDTNAVVVGIPYGGVCVASVIAENLALPLQVMPCRKIKHPAGGNRNIGSVSQDDVFIHDCSHTIPQDYIYHQIALLQNAISHEIENYYYGKEQSLSFRYRPVILVDDLLVSSDTMMACIRSIKKQSPLKLIVAVPVVAAEAARIVRAEVEDIEFLKMDASVESPKEYFIDFPKIDELKVKELLESSRNKVRMYNNTMTMTSFLLKNNGSK